jgi:hypothetical protein
MAPTIMAGQHLAQIQATFAKPTPSLPPACPTRFHGFVKFATFSVCRTQLSGRSSATSQPGNVDGCRDAPPAATTGAPAAHPRFPAA